jgi:hypothetical protein
MRRFHSNNPHNQACDDDYAELRADDEAARQYRNRLIANPNCNDPNHPGCHECREDAE